MNRIKKGNIVTRKSHGKDIIFVVKNIICTSNEKIAILKGLIERIEVDSNIKDLEMVDPKTINKKIKVLHHKMNNRIMETKEKRKNDEYRIGILTPNVRNREKIVTGKILHLDGDKKYSQKSSYYYQKLGLNAIVKNIPEYKQSKVVYALLQTYNPDILVITRT